MGTGEMRVVNNDTFINKRVANTNNSTLGILYLNTTPIGFVIEDEPRVTKVVGETRIPKGRYKLVINRTETPKTLEYRTKYAWFKYHIELQDVPGFTNVYVHIGNTEQDTMGCQVIGLDASTANGEFINMRSGALFAEWYKETYHALELGFTVYWEIKD